MVNISICFSGLICGSSHPFVLQELFQRAGDVRGEKIFFHFNCTEENFGESPTEPKDSSLNELTFVQTKTTSRIQFTCLQYTVFLAYFPQEMGLTSVMVLFIYLYAITPTLITFERVGQFQPNLTEQQSFQKY